jgi:hypothetical protein
MFGCGALGVDEFRWNSDNKVRTDLGIINKGDADKMRLEYAGQRDRVIRRASRSTPMVRLTTISLIMAYFLFSRRLVRR